MPKFSHETLSTFADACASIPIRPLDRAFDRAGIRVGVTEDDSGGARRTRFRQFLSTVDQRDSRQLQQLGDALGALIDEVATSKQTFLIRAAESDGFEYVDGAFRVAATDATSFALARLGDSDGIDDRIRRLHVLAQDRPVQAIAGALQVADSASGLAGADYGVRGTGKAVIAVRDGLQRLLDLVKGLEQLANAKATASTMTSAHAILAADAAAAFVRFVATTTAQKQSRKAGSRRP